jgi:hypothetical protein
VLLINAPNHHDETTQEIDKDSQWVAVDCVQMSKGAEARWCSNGSAIKRCEPIEEQPNGQE